MNDILIVDFCSRKCTKKCCILLDLYICILKIKIIRKLNFINFKPCVDVAFFLCYFKGFAFRLGI